MGFNGSPGRRLRFGDAVLMAAKTVNTKPVQARLDAFASTHNAFAAAQARADKAEKALAAAQAKVLQRDREQDEAVEMLARALVNEGQSRARPFAGVGGPTPAAIMRLPVADEAKAIHTLVAAFQRHNGLARATQDAIQRADKAARAIEKAVEPIAALEAAVDKARQARDALISAWDNNLAALKRGARAAVDDGEPHLYAALLPPLPRNGARNGKRAPKPLPAPPPPAPVAAESAQ